MAKRIVTIMILIIGLASILPSLNAGDGGKEKIQAVNGTMDLTNWNVNTDQILNLDGEWEFYWNQLLTPEDFQGRSAKAPELTGYMQVPSLWNGKQLGGTVLPVFGCATYRLVIKNVPEHGVLGLKKENIRFSSVVYVNGQRLLSDGVPAAEAVNYTSGNKYKQS